MTGFDDVALRLSDPQLHASFCYALAAVYKQDAAAISAAMAGIGPNAVSKITWGPGSLGYAYGVLFPKTLAVLIPGLAGIADWTQAILGSNQVPCVNCAGSIGQFAANVGVAASAAIDGAITAACQTFGVPMVDFILAGHSQGGATATAYLTQRPGGSPPNVSRKLLLTYSSPRVLDPIAAGSLGVPHYQISQSGDVIPEVPPVLWVAGYPPASFVPGNLLNYLHHGVHFEVNRTGAIRELPNDGPPRSADVFPIVGGLLSFLIQSSVHNVGNVADALSRSRSSLAIEGQGFTRVDPSPLVLGAGGMATYKVIYFFDQNKWGWSERFFLSEPTITAAFNKATGAALVAARMNMLSVSSAAGAFNPYLTYIRVSNVDHDRDALVKTINPPALTSSSQYADIPNTAVLMRWANDNNVPGVGDRYQGHTFIKGFDDDMVQQGGHLNLTPAFQLFLNVWINELVTGRFGQIFKNRDLPFQKNVMIVNNGANIDVTTDAPHGMIDGDTVEIRNVEPRHILNGEFPVINTASQSYSIPNANFAGAINKFGKSRKVQLIFVPIISGQALRATHRIAGRPFDSPVGRRKRT